MKVAETRWIKRHLEICHLISTWSKDPNTKVGSVIVTEDGKPRSWGFNGIPMGVADHPDRFKKPAKYNFFAHAERNAIDLSESNLHGCILFCTHTPCSACAASIINNQIKEVYVDGSNGFLKGSFVYRNDTSIECHFASLEMFTESGVGYYEFEYSDTQNLYKITKNKGESIDVHKISS